MKTSTKLFILTLINMLLAIGTGLTGGLISATQIPMYVCMGFFIAGFCCTGIAYLYSLDL